MSTGPRGQDRQRLRVLVRGAVQGVGFRPFVYRLADELGLDGWVLNSTGGVRLEVEGEASRLQTFLRRLRREPPPRAVVQSFEHWWLDAAGLEGFTIRESEAEGARTVLVLPDVATCPACRAEIRDPADRRYRYPFTNCTHCGPRYTILRDLPYDRPNTSMAGFRMCARCREEYENPRDRRFHAQPNACPACGPQVALWDAETVLAERDEALRGAVRALRAGQVVAVKGLGGFHLLVDARDEAAVQRLRRRKRREEKPLALLYPDMETVRRDCEVEPEEEALLVAPEAPIVLLRRRREARVAAAVAPGNPSLGVMLPYTPLHHLLLADLGFPVVATSGNLSEEPICTEEDEARGRLAGIADLYLVHDRPIVRHADDSVARVVDGQVLVLRRARGFAPLPVPLPVGAGHAPVLAFGGHLKNSLVLAAAGSAFISQHIGDLDNAAARAAHRRVAADLQRLYGVRARAAVCDLHPDYGSTLEAEASGLPLQQVQHHVAHVLAAMAENEVAPPVLGVSWDGTGWGPDGTIWGGEFLRIGPRGWRRIACLRPFPLPGGAAAVREPRRSALGLLFEALGGAALERRDLAPVAAFAREELRALGVLLERGVQAPRGSSAGRLFDAVASLLDLRQRCSFEGQAAMELEWLQDAAPASGPGYPLPLRPGRGGPAQLDWQPLLEALLRDLEAGLPAPRLARRFHDALVDGILAVAAAAGENRVVLTGGCFQNRALTERACARLREAGMRPVRHQRVPPNDGGLAVGQAAAAVVWPAAARPEEC